MGDREVETHFTYDVEQDLHVSTYLNLGIEDTPGMKTKVDQWEVGG